MNVAVRPLRTQRVREARRPRPVAVDAAIVCSSAAALAHIVEAPAHFAWWPASGLFFVALGAAQLVCSALLLRGAQHPKFVLACIWGTVAVILLYVASRTVGVPMAPPVPFHGGRWVPGRSVVPNGAKYVGPTDVFTLLSEVLLVILLLGMLPSRSKARAVNALMCIGLGLWAAAVFAVLR